MSKERKQAVFKDCLQHNGRLIVLYLLVNGLNLAIQFLYGNELEPFFYVMAVTGFFLCCFVLVDYLRLRRSAAVRERALVAIAQDRFSLPEPGNLLERDYQQMLSTLGKTLDDIVATAEEDRQDMLDYYTKWVHQIKTPITVMKLYITDDLPRGKELSAELFRIEQYVDMVLAYIRLGSSSNDLVVKEQNLDEIIRESIRRYASQFILRQLKLEFTPTEQTVITDRKWLGTILDQLISNAIKYTPSGMIRISYEEGFLKIQDTGIGIAKEDQPRIFEKGYTGINGRAGQNSSGLGLYLSKKAADKLDISLQVESEPGKGSTFFLDLRQPDVRYD